MTLFGQQAPAGPLIALGVSSLASIALGFRLTTPSEADILLRQFGYWFILTAFALFVALSVRAYGRVALERIRRPSELLVIAACGIAALFLYSREGPGFKVVMDEPTLSSTALSMHLHRSPVISEPAIAENAAATALDKRPFFYPLLVSLVHDVTGFRPENAFYLNFALTWCLLIAFYHLTRRLSGSGKAAGLAVALLCSSPLLAQNASGGGFDILNCLMIILTAQLAIAFCEGPNRDRLGLLLASATLLAQTRYESALFVGAVAAVVALACSRVKRWSIGWSAAAFPALLLPIAWQNTYIRSQPTFWELKDSMEGPFGFHFLPNNLASAWRYFFAPSSELASNPTFSIIALASLVFALAAIVARPSATRRALGRARLPLVVMLAFTGINFFLLMNYFWGILDDPVASRLALPIIVAAAACFAPLARFIADRSATLNWLPLAAVIGALLCGQIYTSGRTPEGNTLLQRRFEWARQELENQIGPRALVISPSNRIWTPYRVNAISTARAVMGVERLKLHFDLGTYDAIYVEQYSHLPLDGSSDVYHPILNKGSDLGPAFKLETIAKTSFYPYSFTRLSKVVAIDLQEVAKAGGWDAYVKAYAVANPQKLIPLTKQEMESWERSLP